MSGSQYALSGIDGWPPCADAYSARHKSSVPIRLAEMEYTAHAWRICNIHTLHVGRAYQPLSHLPADQPHIVHGVSASYGRGTAEGAVTVVGHTVLSDGVVTTADTAELRSRCARTVSLSTIRRYGWRHKSIVGLHRASRIQRSPCVHAGDAQRDIMFHYNTEQAIQPCM